MNLHAQHSSPRSRSPPSPPERVPPPPSAVPDGCAANPECLVENVLGGAAPVQPAASAGATIPTLAVEDASRRGRHADRPVRVTGIGLVRARAAGAPKRVRRLVGAGVHELKVPLAPRPPGATGSAVSVVDGAGRRDTATRGRVRSRGERPAAGSGPRRYRTCAGWIRAARSAASASASTGAPISRTRSSTTAASSVRRSGSASRPSASNASSAWPTGSSRSTTCAPIVLRTLRVSAWAQTAPKRPVLAPTTATGFSRSAFCAKGREAQSSAFFSAPGIE